jgi:pilus assembly protein CpaB
MNLKTWAHLAIAIVLGGIAAKVGHDLLARRAAPKSVVVNVARVVVARDNVAAGAALKATDLATSNVAEGSVAPGSFTDINQLVSRVVTMPVIKGQPILKNMLAPEGSGKGLTAIVPDGMRAVTLEVNEVSGVAGLLVTGCHVDIVTTLAGGGDASSMISRTVARNLPIVAVGRRLSESGKDDGPESQLARTVTLLVTPRQAELIDLATHNGMPRLVLRGSRDSRSDLGDSSEGVTLAELRGLPAATAGSGSPITRLFTQLLNPNPTPATGASLFTGSRNRTTKPADQDDPRFRQVVIIRNTREEAVRVAMPREVQRRGQQQTTPQQQPDLANTDGGDAIKSPAGN